MQAGCGGSFFYYQPLGSRAGGSLSLRPPGLHNKSSRSQDYIERHSLKKQKPNKRLTGDTVEASRPALLSEWSALRA